MKAHDKQDLITSIENCISAILSHPESDDRTIVFAFRKHGVKDLYRASLGTLQDLFNELFALEADLHWQKKTAPGKALKGPPS